jgi:hypothetical protein
MTEIIVETDVALVANEEVPFGTPFLAPLGSKFTQNEVEHPHPLACRLFPGEEKVEEHIVCDAGSYHAKYSAHLSEGDIGTLLCPAHFRPKLVPMHDVTVRLIENLMVVDNEVIPRFCRDRTGQPKIFHDTGTPTEDWTWSCTDEVKASIRLNDACGEV